MMAELIVIVFLSLAGNEPLRDASGSIHRSAECGCIPHRCLLGDLSGICTPLLSPFSLPSENPQCVIQRPSLQVEFWGFVADRRWISPVFSRKFTHIGVGSAMLSGMSCFPIGHSWPGRLGIFAFLVGFMFAFATIAHMSEHQLAKLPPTVIPPVM